MKVEYRFLTVHDKKNGKVKLKKNMFQKEKNRSNN